MSGRRLFLLAALPASVLAGCEEPFEPFERNDVAFYSVFGHLDLYADTQWIRVTPVRQKVAVGPEPLDAVVTLEHLGSGRVVTLRDSLFLFQDEGLGGAAYAHNYWTTEPLQPAAAYRLTVTRSDGARTTARVEMPAHLEFTIQNDLRVNDGGPGRMTVRAEELVFVDALYDVAFPVGGADGCGGGAGYLPGTFSRRENRRFNAGGPPLHGVPVGSDSLVRNELCDRGRREVRITSAAHDWPYHPDLSDVEVALPGTVTSNVEGGLGFVGGVAVRTVPYHRCQILAERPDRPRPCEIQYDAESAMIVGKVVPRPCPATHPLPDVRLVERFPNGGAIRRHWRAGSEGDFRFEEVEPGAELELQFSGGAPPVRLPPLAPGERRVVPDVSLTPAPC